MSTEHISAKCIIPNCGSSLVQERIRSKDGITYSIEIWCPECGVQYHQKPKSCAINKRSFVYNKYKK